MLTESPQSTAGATVLLDGTRRHREPRGRSGSADAARVEPPDGAPRVRGTAARAPGQLASRVPDVRQDAVDRIVEMLDEPGFFSVILAIQPRRLLDPRTLGPLSRIHQSAGDGRTRRMAYEAMVRIRRGRTSEEGLAELRAQVEALQEQNAKLTRRLDKLEPVEDESWGGHRYLTDNLQRGGHRQQP